MHGTDRALAAVPTRPGPQCNYGRYPACVSQLSQSPSPFDTRAQTAACHETHTALHYIHTGRRGCMLTHARRHLPHTQRPHTRCFSHTRSLIHTVPHSHTAVRTRVPFPSHTWFHSHTVLRARVPFPSHTPYHSHTQGHSPAVSHSYRGVRTRMPFPSHTRPLSHAVPLVHTACWEARTPAHSPPHHSHTGSPPHTGTHSYLSPHTPGQSRRGLVLPQGVPGSLYPPSSACTRSQNSPPQLRLARPNPPGRDQLQGSTASPSIPEGGYPAARTGSQHAPRARPHCPPLPLCVCVCVTNFFYHVFTV